MINQQELPGYIQQSIPELSGMCNKANCSSPYDIAGQMVKYTTNNILQHDLNHAKECLTLAEHLYLKGNVAIKNAIENVFVYSFSHTFFHDEVKRKKLMDILPASLYKLYKKQVLYSHL